MDASKLVQSKPGIFLAGAAQRSCAFEAGMPRRRMTWLVWAGILGMARAQCPKGCDEACTGAGAGTGGASKAELTCGPRCCNYWRCNYWRKLNGKSSPPSQMQSPRRQRIFGCLPPPKRAAATMSPTLPLSKNNVPRTRQCPASWQRLQAKLGTANDFMSASPPPPGPGMRLASCGVASAAIYFPGFHRSVENDRFWGKGWTEWDNIRNLKWDPLALARVAHPMRYYDTADGGATIREQAKKAREAGLKAFMLYHYYFGSARTSLNKPIEDAVIRGKGLGIHFFFSWSDQPLPHCQTHCQTLAVP